MENKSSSPKVSFSSELFDVEAVVGDNAVQTSIIKDVMLDGKCREVKIEGSVVENLTVQCMDNKVIAEGTVKARATYTDTAERRGEREVEEEFSQLIDLPGSAGDLQAYAHARVESAKPYILESSEEGSVCRTVFVLEIFVKATRRVSLEVVTATEGVPPEEVVKGPMKLENFIGQNYKQARIEEKFSLEQPADRLAFTEVRIAEAGYNLDEGKVQAEGTLAFRFDYYHEGVRYSAEEQRPFAQTVELAGTSRGMVVDFLPRILEVDCRISGDYLEFNVLIDTFVRVAESVELEVVSDIEGVPVNKESFYASRFVGDGASKFNLSRRIELATPVERVEAAAFWFTGLDCEVLEDKVAVAGTMETEILYTPSESEPETLRGYQEEKIEEDFRHFVHVPGVRPGMNVYVYPRLDQVNYEINGTELKQTGIIAIFARAVKYELCEVVLAEEVEIPEEASLIIYIVQPGDTALKIARRYGVDPEALKEVNQIENPDLLMPGEKLLLLLK